MGLRIFTFIFIASLPCWHTFCKSICIPACNQLESKWTVFNKGYAVQHQTLLSYHGVLALCIMKLNKKGYKVHKLRTSKRFTSCMEIKDQLQESLKEHISCDKFDIGYIEAGRQGVQGKMRDCLPTGYSQFFTAAFIFFCSSGWHFFPEICSCPSHHSIITSRLV